METASSNPAKTAIAEAKQDAQETDVATPPPAASSTTAFAMIATKLAVPRVNLRPPTPFAAQAQEFAIAKRPAQEETAPVRPTPSNPMANPAEVATGSRARADSAQVEICNVRAWRM